MSDILAFAEFPKEHWADLGACYDRHPPHFTGRVKKAAQDADADWEVASMDDQATFGPVLHRLAFADAINRDPLCD